MSVLNETFKRKGRFLRKLDSTNDLELPDAPNRNDRWVLADLIAVIAKVKQALRDKDPTDVLSQASKGIPAEPKVGECANMAEMEPLNTVASPTINSTNDIRVFAQLQGRALHCPSLQALLRRHKLERHLLNRHYALALAQVTRRPLVYATQSGPYWADAPRASTPCQTLELTHSSTLTPRTTAAKVATLPRSVLGELGEGRHVNT